MASYDKHDKPSDKEDNVYERIQKIIDEVTKGFISELLFGVLFVIMFMLVWIGIVKLWFFIEQMI